MLIQELMNIVAALLIGVGLTALIYRSRVARLKAGNEIELDRVNIRLAELSQDLAAAVNARDALQREAYKLAQERSMFEERASQIPKLERDLQQKEQHIQVFSDRFAKVQAELTAAQTELATERENEEKLRNVFATLSREALNMNSRSFLDLATAKLKETQENAKGDLEKRQQAIGELLAPLHIRLKEFEQKVEEVYRTEAAERNTLKGEISRLFELNQQLSREASNLVVALKGDTKKQGNWGELILEKVLEFSGLRKGQEYQLQGGFKDELGKLQKPDAIVYLPEKKHVIIDAKVSLVAYERCVSASTDEERMAASDEHVASVKRHIQDLSTKNYPAIADLDAPDFTLLFMPIESSFGLAIQADNHLFAYAWERKIIIVSPSTLLATLRTIASIWKQERQTKNALEIAERAGKMYDKFTGFIDDLLTVGKKMNDAKGTYDEAMKKLSTGPGNLIRQSEQLREMGAKTSKILNPTLLDRAFEPSPELPAVAGGELPS